MNTNKSIVRMAALTALVTLGACNSITDVPQASRDAHDPWKTYKLGTVYNCQEVGLPDVRLNTETLPTPGFGCSHQSNITVMAKNPEDLHTPRALTPSDPRRTQRIIDSYVAGEDTTTTRRAQGTQQLIQ